MSQETDTIDRFVQSDYKYGFYTDIEAESVPAGLSEDVIRWISARKEEPDFLLEWRLKAYRHWLGMKEPRWPQVSYPAVDFQDIVYYSAPKSPQDGPQSLEEVDPKLLETYEKLGIPLHERARLAGVAVDAVFDSVSVATTFKETLAEHGVIFCSFSEAAQEHPELVRKYLGSVVPYTDNFFATLNSAVFSDGSFVYMPKGVRCPMELSTYFRINAARVDRPVRADADHRRRGLHTSATSRAAPPRCGTRTSCTPRWWSWWPWRDARSSTPRSRTGTPATSRARGASTTSSPSGGCAREPAPASPGPRWRPARPSPGSIPAASSRGTTRSASSIRWP